MNVFKRKYKRSQWMEGLLECENLLQEGYEYLKNDGVHVWFDHKDVIKFAIPVRQIQRCIGIMDYLQYYENNLK